MGTVYRTDCGCIASHPEPNPAEYPTLERFELAVEHWRQNWQEAASRHVYDCPKSGYYLATEAAR